MNIDERASAVSHLLDEVLEANQRRKDVGEALVWHVDSLAASGWIDTTDWPESAREDLRSFRAARLEWRARHQEWDEARRVLDALRTQREATGVVPR